jgi:hypothetical protein
VVGQGSRPMRSKSRFGRPGLPADRTGSLAILHPHFLKTQREGRVE